MRYTYLEEMEIEGSRGKITKRVRPLLSDKKLAVARFNWTLIEE